MNDAGSHRVLIDDAGTVLSGVADAGLNAAVTQRMLNSIYRLSVPLVAAPPLIGVALVAVYVGTGWILVCAVLAGIALGALLLIGLRLMLGFGWLLVGFLDQLRQLPDAVRSLNDEVRLLKGGVDELRGGVSELDGNVAPLSNVVEDLTGHVNSLQRSVDGVQFWRGPSRLRKAPGDRKEPEG